MFIQELFKDPVYYVSLVAAFMVSVCIHEFCHAFVANRLGDHTAKRGGYATLNPFKTMGIVSIVVLLLFGFTWGAVPVKRNEPSRVRRGAVSMAGPLSNLLLMLLVSMLLKCLYVATPLMTLDFMPIFYARSFLCYMLIANAILFIFNILPIPPLDGWRVIETFLPNNLIPSPQILMGVSRAFLILCCISSSPFSKQFDAYFSKTVNALVDRFIPKELEVLNLISKGDKLLQQKDYTEAIKIYEQAAKMGSKYQNLAKLRCEICDYYCTE